MAPKWRAPVSVNRHFIMKFPSPLVVSCSFICWISFPLRIVSADSLSIHTLWFTNTLQLSCFVLLCCWFFGLKSFDDADLRLKFNGFAACQKELLTTPFTLCKYRVWPGSCLAKIHSLSLSEPADYSSANMPITKGNWWLLSDFQSLHSQIGKSLHFTGSALSG